MKTQWMLVILAALLLAAAAQHWEEDRDEDAYRPRRRFPGYEGPDEGMREGGRGGEVDPGGMRPPGRCPFIERMRARGVYGRRRGRFGHEDRGHRGRYGHPHMSVWALLDACAKRVRESSSSSWPGQPGMTRTLALSAVGRATVPSEGMRIRLAVTINSDELARGPMRIPRPVSGPFGDVAEVDADIERDRAAGANLTLCARCAYREATRRATSLLNLLTELNETAVGANRTGVTRMHTTGVGLRPGYDWDRNTSERVFRRYTGTAAVEFTAPPDLLAQALDAALDAGVTDVGELEAQRGETALLAARNEARMDALANLRALAAAALATLGLPAREPSFLSVNLGEPAVPPAAYNPYGGGGAAAGASAMDASTSTKTTSLVEGAAVEVTVTAQGTVLLPEGRRGDNTDKKDRKDKKKKKDKKKDKKKKKKDKKRKRERREGPERGEREWRERGDRERGRGGSGGFWPWDDAADPDARGPGEWEDADRERRNSEREWGPAEPAEPTAPVEPAADNAQPADAPAEPAAPADAREAPGEPAAAPAEGWDGGEVDPGLAGRDPEAGTARSLIGPPAQ